MTPLELVNYLMVICKSFGI